MKRKLFNLLILTVVFTICLQNVFVVSAEETEPIVVEETHISIEDHTFDNMGWLGMRALPPVGFCGIVCVDVRNVDTGDVQTIQLEYGDMYIGGQWLVAGNYAVDRVYVADGDLFLVDSNMDQLCIEPEGKTNMELVIRENPEVVEQFEKEQGTFTPEPSKQPVIDTTQESETETTTTVTEEETQVTTETISSGDSDESDGLSISSVIIVLAATAVFVGFIFLMVVIIRKFQD